MFSSLQRLQQTTNHAITVLFAITAFIVVTSYIQLHFDGANNIVASMTAPKTTHTMRTSRTFGSLKREPKENIRINKMDMTVDLSPLFNYNTKQVFAYLTYEYPGHNELSSSKVTFWDKIITSKEDAVLKLDDLKSKYSCWDHRVTASNFTTYDGELKLEYNIQPNAGFLLWGETKGALPVHL